LVVGGDVKAKARRQRGAGYEAGHGIGGLGVRVAAIAETVFNAKTPIPDILPPEFGGLPGQKKTYGGFLVSTRGGRPGPGRSAGQAGLTRRVGPSPAVGIEGCWGVLSTVLDPAVCFQSSQKVTVDANRESVTELC
jgi:hypothetical protein